MSCYPNLVSDIKKALTPKEWQVVSYYVTVAEITGKTNQISIARRALENAIAVAMSNNMEKAAKKISEYLQFY